MDRDNNDRPSTTVTRMQLNDNKAGMEGLDKNLINQTILDASKGSKYYENELKKEKQMNERVKAQKNQVDRLTEADLAKGMIEADNILKQLELCRDLTRTIVHIDMDMFYAAVEMRDDPSLKDIPMAVGGIGMLSTSNYIARRYGVRAAMPGFIAKKLCPNLVIVPVNFDKYKRDSSHIREILAEYDPGYCPMSLDEAYLDITDHLMSRQTMREGQRTYLRRIHEDGKMLVDEDTDDNACVCPTVSLHTLDNAPSCSPSSFDDDNNEEDVTAPAQDDIQLYQELSNNSKVEKCPRCQRLRHLTGVTETFGTSVEEAVREMRFRVHQRTRLTASAGIAANLMLAKICSDKKKPNGQYLLPPNKDDIMSFIVSLPIRKVSGIGKVSEKMLNAMEIVMCSDLYKQRAVLYHLYSSTSFQYFMRISAGVGHTQVSRDEDRKSMSVERTFRTISQPGELYQKCQELCNALSHDLKEEAIKGKTITLKLKTDLFEVKSRAQTISSYTSSADVIYSTANELLRGEILAASPSLLKLRLMGIRMSNLVSQGENTGPEQKPITGFLRTKNMPVEKTTGNSAFDKDMTSTNETFDEKVAQSNSTLSNSYMCPVCLKNVTCRNIIQLNIHVDKCLTKSEDYESTKVEDVGLLPNVTIIQKEDESIEDMGLTENTIIEKDNSTTYVCDSQASTSTEDVSLGTADPDSYVGQLQYTCPVCNMKMSTTNLEDFNVHVDECLNRSTIRSIVKEENSNSMKRKESGSVQNKSSNKRRKKSSNQQCSIAQYFKAT